MKQETTEQDEAEQDEIVTKKWLGLIALLVLGVCCFFVIRPFAPALMWAVILSFSLYPVQKKLVLWFRGRKSLAACTVTICIVMLVVGPLTLIGLSLVDDGKKLALTVKEEWENAPAEAPKWFDKIPVLGPNFEEYWSEFAASRQQWLERNQKSAGDNELIEPSRREQVQLDSQTEDEAGRQSLVEKAITAIRKVAIWAGAAVGIGLSQLVISLFLVFFILRDAEKLGGRIKVAVDKIAGERGHRLLLVAGQTVTGVVYGFLGASAAQAVMAGIGFTIAGVPGAVLLGTLTFFVAVIPVGPPLIWGSATIWLFMEGRTGWAIFMLIWGIFGISSIDNVLRPFLVSQGNKMPFALMFLGLIGGAVAFGLVGVFLGPTLLAVAFRLTEEWTSEENTPTIWTKGS